MNIPIISLFLRRSISKIIFFLFLFLSFSSFGQIDVTTADEFHSYESGDTIVFLISSESSGTLDYIIQRDPYLPALDSGSVNVVANAIYEIEYIPDSPGNYFCFVADGSQENSAVASYSRRDMQPIKNAPSDFDTYWAGIRTELDAVPLDLDIAEAASYSTDYSTTYKISLASINNYRVYAYMTIPDVTGPFMGLVQFPAFGNSNVPQPDVEMSERLGAIVITLNVHPVPLDSILANPYSPEIFLTDTVHYIWAIAGGMRVIDYIYSRSDFDGEHLGLFGVSQGAGLAMLMSGIDNRVDLLTIGNCTLAQHDGLPNDKPSGFPRYLKDVLGDPSELTRISDAVSYYDAIFSAQRFNGPMLSFTSLKDEVTASEACWPAYNQFKGKFVHARALDAGHGDIANEYWVGRRDFVRRYFPTNPSWPWPSSDIGYEADAGPDQERSSLSTNIEGHIDANGTIDPSSIAVHWEKVSGLGTVTFANSESHSTTVTFDQTGEYELRFVGKEVSNLSDYQRYTSIEDRVIISIGLAPLPVVLVGFSAKKEDNRVRLSWETKMEYNNDGFILERSLDGKTWRGILDVEGQGNEKMEHHYEEYDEFPSKGINYYRLVQVDYGGQPTISKVVSVWFEHDIQPLVFPNPTTHYVFFDNISREGMLLNVFNLVGQRVITQKIENDSILNLENYPNGEYLLQVIGKNEIFYKNVMLF